MFSLSLPAVTVVVFWLLRVASLLLMMQNQKFYAWQWKVLFKWFMVFYDHDDYDDRRRRHHHHVTPSHIKETHTHTHMLVHYLTQIMCFTTLSGGKSDLKVFFFFLNESKSDGKQFLYITETRIIVNETKSSRPCLQVNWTLAVTFISLKLFSWRYSWCSQDMHARLSNFALKIFFFFFCACTQSSVNCSHFFSK